MQSHSKPEIMPSPAMMSLLVRSSLFFGFGFWTVPKHPGIKNLDICDATLTTDNSNFGKKGHSLEYNPVNSLQSKID